MKRLRKRTPIKLSHLSALPRSSKKGLSMKLPRRYAPILRAALMAFFMGSCMSGIVTYVNIGFSDNFFSHWGHAFVISYVIAMPLMLVFLPVASRVSNKFTQ